MALSNSARQSLYVFSGTLSSRILGFVRVALIGTTLGLTRLNDSYSLANETPNMMYELILGSLIASTMVPFFVQQYKRKDRDADNALMSFIIVSAAILSLVTLALSPLIAKLMTILNPTNSAHAQQELVVFFLLFFLPQIFFYALTYAMQAFLSARSRFVAAAFAPVVNNIIAIATLLYVRSHAHELGGSLSELRSSHVVLILALGTSAGVIAMTVIVSVAYFRAGGRFVLTSLRNKHVSALVARSKWMVAYAVANQLALFVIVAFANAFPGGVYMYLAAWSFFQFPHGLVATTIMTTMIPRITHTLDELPSENGEVLTTKDTADITRNTATGLTIAMSSIAAMGISVCVPALVILLAHGSISTSQAEHTGRVLVGFLAFLPAFSLYLFIVRLANAVNKTKKIFFINVLQNLLNIVLALLFRHSWGIVGLSVAFSMSYLLVLPLSIRVINTSIKSVLLDARTTLVMVATCTLSGICGYFVARSISNSYLAVVSALLVCLAIQSVGALVSREQLRLLARLIYKRTPNTTVAPTQ